MAMSAKTPAENLIDLYRTVNQLARPHAIRTRVVNRKTGAPETVSVTHESLIVTLRNLVYGGSGGNGNHSASAPDSRTVLNPVAYAHLERLRDDILASMRLLIPELVALPKGWTEDHALGYWLDLFHPAAIDGQYDDDTIATAARLFAGWRHTILSQFDTPQVMTSNKPCPKCDSEWAIVGDGEEAQRVHCIIVSVGRSNEYHRAECRGCGALWVGGEQVAKLAADQRDRAADREDIRTLRNAPDGIEPKLALDNDPVPVPQ